METAERVNGKEMENSARSNKRLFKLCMKGKWEQVVNEYNKDKGAHTAIITKSGDTALHVAVTDGQEEVVKQLLEELKAKGTLSEALRIQNKRKNTALHFAASMGTLRMIECIAEADPSLMSVRNVDGETPLFLAALHGRKDAFMVLHCISRRGMDPAAPINYTNCRRNDGDTILHSAINGDYFDLAFQIIHLYEDLVNSMNENGASPLHLLASKPSAFRSGSHLGRVATIIYYGILVKELKPELNDQQSGKTEVNGNIYPKNYQACVDLMTLMKDAAKIVIFPSKHNRQKNGTESREAKALKNTSTKVAETNSTVTNKSPLAHNLIEKLCGRKNVIESGDLEASENTAVINESHRTESGDPKSLENTAVNGGETDSSGSEDKAWSHPLFPANWLCCVNFLKFIYMVILTIFGRGTTIIEKIRRRKEKHEWSVQIMNEILNRTSMYEYDDDGSKPSGSPDSADEGTSPYSVKEGGTDTSDGSTKELQPSTANEEAQQQNKDAITEEQQQPSTTKAEKDQKQNKGDKKDKWPVKVKKMETPILIAAKNGVTEMVERILEMFPVAVHDMDANKKNIVLLAIENRQPHLYDLLNKRKVLKESLFKKVDKEGNSALHLAAKFGGTKPWLIPGAALQMHWEIKWYLYVKESMPPHFFRRYNNQNKTPKEIFTETHKDLVRGGGEWLKQTSESCSLVAALIATVAFATASTIPGGVHEQNGMPIFENTTAFKVFAISSLIALCCSVTSVVLFLSILTSRFQEYDFGRSLPRKLIVGLTTLFMSIGSMLLSFCAGHFLVLRNKLRYAALPIYAVTCLPVTLFALAQFPLYFDLVWATFRKVPQRSYKSTRL